MTTHHRPSWANLRTDPDAHADRALGDLLSHIRLGTRSQSYVRDSLAESFHLGQEQGETRALRLLLLARAKAMSDEAEAAIVEVIALLAPDVAERLRPEGE